MAGEEGKRQRGRPKSLFKRTEVEPVKVLDRGIRLLQVLAQQGAQPLSDLARALELPASTTYRLLATLHKRKLVEFDEQLQFWSVGIEAFRIGSKYLANINLVEVARKTLRDLMEQTGETANLAICREGEVVFVSQVETPNPIRAFYQAGTRSHMHASGIGKALLSRMKPEEVDRIIEEKGLLEFTGNTITSKSAFLEDLELSRNRGWAYDDEERYVGMRCIASSISNQHGEVIAGISISGPTLRLTEAFIEQTGPKVRAAADELTFALGGTLKPAPDHDEPGSDQNRPSSA